MSEPVSPGVAAAQAYSPRPLTDGERWTAQALYDLRSAEYGARAWRRFLGDALARSGDTRRQRPALVRQARLWGVAGALAWLGGCRLAQRTAALQPAPRRGALWWLAVWQMLDWHVGMAEGGDGRPRERLSPADAVTLTRFWLVPWLPAARASPTALTAFILAGGITDALDGRIARRHGRTRLGRDLDTTADLAFVLVAAWTLHAADRLPRFAAQVLVARYAIGVSLSAMAVLGRARRPAIRARPWGAVLRIMGLALCAAGRNRSAAAVLTLGCCVPPVSTAPKRSIA